MVSNLLMIIICFIEICIFIFGVALCFTQFYYYVIGLFVLMLIFFLALNTLFNKSTIHAIIKKDVCYYEFGKYLKTHPKELVFTKSDQGWKLSDSDFEFCFSHYLFQRSFIISFVVRQLRYAYISEKKPLNLLFKKKLMLPVQSNLVLNFVTQKKTYSFKVMEEGNTKNTLISKQISKSHFYMFYYSNYSYNKYMKKPIKINEKIYDEMCK